MTAKEALELTREATRKKQLALIEEAEPMLAVIYERIKAAAEEEKTRVLLGGESDCSDVGCKMAATGAMYTKVGNYIVGVLEKEGYKVTKDNYGVHITWADADKPVPRGGMPDR